MGKFHGVNAATGPTGSFSTICWALRLREGTMRPYTRWAFVGKPFDDFGGRHGLDLGLGQGLALLLHHDGGD
jgi:hypothetical protein